MLHRRHFMVNLRYMRDKPGVRLPPVPEKGLFTEA